MDFSSEYTANVYTIPIENIGLFEKRNISGEFWDILGDLNTVERANQARPTRDEANEKNLQALARRQRRLDGLQLFEKTKLNR
jgi:hypothetical protein